MTTYNYDTPIDLAPIMNVIDQGNVYMLTVRDVTGFMYKVRMFRSEEDQPGTMRLYNNQQNSNVQVAGQSLEWVQIPEIPTDAWVEGEMHTGTITFREHLAAEPVMP